MLELLRWSVDNNVLAVTGAFELLLENGYSVDQAISIIQLWAKMRHYG